MEEFNEQNGKFWEQWPWRWTWRWCGPGAGAVRRVCGGAVPDHHGHPAKVRRRAAWVEVKLLAPHFVLQDALGVVTKVYSSLKLRVFVDDITALLK